MSIPEKLSPMYEQYLAIKKEYPDGFLFYRMGDFYELFFQDAVDVARELQLTLTSRSKDSNVPMAGVPHHALENYASQLIERGFTLVICDQVENPKNAKGLVKRAVTRVITPGTILESNNLNAKEHNYLGAYCFNPQSSNYAFAWLDATTGDWTGFETTKESEVSQWILKIAPREILLIDNVSPPAFLKNVENIHKTFLPQKSHFDKAKSVDILKRVQNVQDMASLGLEKYQDLTRACGALLTYLEQTQKQNIDYLKSFHVLQLKKYMIIDELTEKNLELFIRIDGKKGAGTLIHALDNTLTPAGGRLLSERVRQPFAEKEKILQQQEIVKFFIEKKETRTTLRENLSSFYDIERLSTKIHLNRAFPKDILALGQTLFLMQKIYSCLDTSVNFSPFEHFNIDLKGEEADEMYKKMENAKQILPPKILENILKNWDNLPEIAELIKSAVLEEPAQTVTDGGIFKKGYNEELDYYISLVENNEELLNQALSLEQKNCNLSKLKLGFNRVFGYYYELSRTNIPSNLPEHFNILQTLGNCIRYSTEELKKLQHDILSASEMRKTLEYKLFQELREKLCTVRDRLMYMADIIANIDCSQSFAESAYQNNWTCPEIKNDLNLLITDGRHPVVETLIGKTEFVPNSLLFNDIKRLLLITGPNMAGKSTILRQTAIIVLLSHMGSFVPASKAEIGLTDRIFSRVGASDNIARGQSTFMVEMMETARILRQSTKKSLIILDEIGRGTSTYDGLSLAWAIVEDLTKNKSNSPRTLFATHYHELVVLEGNRFGVYTMNVAIREWQGEIIFLRKLIPGPSDKSYGIEVAKIAGVPASVTQKAKQILNFLEKNALKTHTNALTLSIAQDLSLLPEIATTKKKKTKLDDTFFIPKEQPKNHPLEEILINLNPEEISPIQALSLINEWKLLWGQKQEKDPLEPPF